MAQGKLNAAEMHIDSIVVTQSETDSYNMAINATISADDSTHATIRGFEGTMYLMDVDPPAAFAKLQFPEVRSAAQINVNISQKVAVEDLASLVTFNSHLVQRKTLRVKVEGDTKIRVSGIDRDYPVTFSKEVELNGFDGFNGLSVSDINIAVGAKTNNFNGTSHIPNPTIFTLEVVSTALSTCVKATSADLFVAGQYHLAQLLQQHRDRYSLYQQPDSAPRQQRLLRLG